MRAREFDDPVAVILEEHERRLGLVEGTVAKLMDPERGIYPRLDALQRSAQRGHLRIMLALLGVFGSVVGVLLAVILEHHGR